MSIDPTSVGIHTWARAMASARTAPLGSACGDCWLAPAEATAVTPLITTATHAAINLAMAVNDAGKVPRRTPAHRRAATRGLSVFRRAHGISWERGTDSR